MAIPYLPIALALSEFVPSITRLIAGPKRETQAREIVKIAQRLAGAEDDNALVRTLQNKPEIVDALRKEVFALEVELEQAILQDREDARLRDITLLQTGYPNYRADVMVLAAATGLVACLATITLYRDTLPGEAVGIISTIAGIFGSCLKDAYAFEFGSSRGSKIKDRRLTQLMEP